MSKLDIVNQIMDETVPLRYVRTVLTVVSEQGHDPEPIIERLGFPKHPLRDHVTEFDRIPATLYTRLHRHIMWLLEDEAFGFNMRHRRPAGSFRMLCLFIIHSRDLGHALERAAEFDTFLLRLIGCNLSKRQPVRMLEGDVVEFRFPETLDLFDAPEHLLAYSVAHSIATWRRLLTWLIGQPLNLLQINIACPLPDDLEYFEQLFACKIRFDSDRNAMFFPAHYLRAPLVQSEETLDLFLQQAPYQLLASEPDDTTGIFGQMRRVVGSDLSRDFPSVVEMAQALNMSVRTLRRRLQDVGTTYQQFKDRIRREAACQLLQRPELKINSVAALLGFDEPSAFHRSFKKWTGMTPGDYRTELHRRKLDGDDSPPL